MVSVSLLIKKQIEIMTKYWKIGILTGMLFIPWGCEFNECGDFEQTYLNIQGIEANNVRLIEDGFSVMENLDAEARITYHLYGIQLLPQAAEVVLDKAVSTGSLVSAAYACSPPPAQPSEEIAEIAIFSNASYGQANSSRMVAAGDTLNAVFSIYDTYSGRIVGLPDFLIDDDLGASDQRIILRPEVAPAEAQTHAFTVHYRLENGEFYEVTLPPVVLLP
jgi:hypothetical protein